MKRNPELLVLSREHYRALKLALDAKKAGEKAAPEEIAAVAAFLVEAAAKDLEPHFRVEEAHLLPAMGAAGCHELVARTLEEHRLLREAVVALAAPTPAVLLHFAELLQAHVRFEERELFQAAQEQLDPAALAVLLKH